MTKSRKALTVAVLLAAAGSAVGYALLRPRAASSVPTGGRGSTLPGSASPWFTERARETGLDFVHFNGMSGAFYLPEIMAPGVGLLDYDNDGDLDVFFVQGRMLGAGKTLADALFPPVDPAGLKGRLYRNDLGVAADGTRTLRFTDVTDATGIKATGYGMGVAAGDYNNDGCVDLYVTSLGPNQLFRNNCDGTFTDVSKESRTDDSGWSSSAAFVDYDRDGWLDLFVGHYLNYSTATNIQCSTASGKPEFCPPQVYSAQPSHLFHNNRDGTFTDLTTAAGLSREFGPALGVATADFNGDGWIDIYVANDGQPNQMWINQRDGTFNNAALLSGTALGAEGDAKSSMGVDAGDFDNDGDEDLFITELTGQGSDLYVNDGSGMFVDDSARARIRSASLPFTGFGAAWFDFDNDGWLDILAVNGTIQSIEELARAKNPFPLHQRKQLFRNLGDGQFEDVTARAGAAFARAAVGRGAAFGDIDNDGDVDVVVGNDNGRAELLINEAGRGSNWIGLRLVGGQTPSGKVRDLVGARAGIVRADGPTFWRRARADGSYQSANDPRVLVGLGPSRDVPRARVIWPDGRIEEWRGLPINRYATLKEGSGTPAKGGTGK